MDRAYSVFEVKAVEDGEDGERIIEGIATTPTTDRSGDVVEPMGGEFKLPLPFLYQHDKNAPIGQVLEVKPSKAGVRIRAQIAKITEPGKLKDRLDEAWHSIKHSLVRGLSVGFRPIQVEPIKGTFGIRYLKWELLELSAVTIPANSDATISRIKSIDLQQQQLTAASGHEGAPDSQSQPGAAGKPTKPVTKKGSKMNVAEQIKAFEAKRAAAAAAQEALMLKASEAGETLDAEQEEEYDARAEEIVRIDAHLKRLKAFESAQASTATPVVKAVATDPEAASAARNGGGAAAVISVRDRLPPGCEFARYVKCLAMAKGNTQHALEIAKGMYPDQPRIQTVLKAAVAAGTTTDSTWAAPLVEYQQFAGDFVEFLRPQTIIGKFGQNGIPDLMRVPFNVKIPGQTSGGSASWVGEGAPKPLTKFDFAATELRWAKVANIAVLTDELVRFSSPSADTLVRNALAAAIIERIDIDFVDPNKAAVANVSPASITNGVTPIVSAGGAAADIRTDVKAVFGAFIANRLSPTTGVWIMNATTALALSQIRNALGQAEFPGLTMNGGTFEGLPVIVSQYVPDGEAGSPSAGSTLILVNAGDIWLADDGQVVVDASREASLQMESAPTNTPVGIGSPAAPVETTMVSMFQTNSIAIRAERFINWARRRTGAVAYLSGVNYTGV